MDDFNGKAWAADQLNAQQGGAFSGGSGTFNPLQSNTTNPNQSMAYNSTLDFGQAAPSADVYSQQFSGPPAGGANWGQMLGQLGQLAQPQGAGPGARSPTYNMAGVSATTTQNPYRSASLYKPVESAMGLLSMPRTNLRSGY